jgi:Domain of unknown function (DUF4169)
VARAHAYSSAGRRAGWKRRRIILTWGRTHRGAEGIDMADIVNLNHYRKQRGRQEAERKAAANRVRFGRSKADRGKAERENAKSSKDLDDKRLE